MSKKVNEQLNTTFQRQANLDSEIYSPNLSVNNPPHLQSSRGRSVKPVSPFGNAKLDSATRGGESTNATNK